MRVLALLTLATLVAMTGATRAAETSATFFVRIHPEHANFMKTMTAAEGQAMTRHFEYWKARMAEHKLILAGAVYERTLAN